jgi:RND family efflux transporter MFP subunit
VRQEKALWNEAVEYLNRARDLHLRNAISEAEIERLDAAERVAAARYTSALNGVDEKIALIGVRTAELALARQRLQEGVIRSPFDGELLQRQVAPGEYVPIGQAICTIVRSNPLRYRGTIPERHARQLKVGQSVTIRIESFPEPRSVRVTRISPVLDEMTRALTFEALVDNSDGRLQTGLFAEGEVVLDSTARSLVVPPTAILEFAGAEKVWKLVDGMAREQEIRTGRRRSDAIEIVNGLVAGDRILLEANSGQVARVDAIDPRPGTQANPTAVAGSRDPAASTEASSQ